MADLIPVIRGKMGTHEYYSGKMTFQEIAAKVQFYDDVSGQNRDVEKLLQRELKKRSADMTEYLVRQPERFYGAIVVAAWGGKPDYVQVKMEDHPLLDDDFEFGLLKFNGKQEFFALDGQHRVKSIKDAIESVPSLRTEEVSVIFITHQRTDEGNISTRRLFHTLNRYAKPTTQGENIALDEDNVVSITTRRLLRGGVRFLNPSCIELERKNLTKTQDDKFTSLAALYDFNLAALNATFKFTKSYLRFRPDPGDIENVYDAISSLWREMANGVEALHQLEARPFMAGELRAPGGVIAEGHLLLRPVGLRIYGELLAATLAAGGNSPIDPADELDVDVWNRALDRVAMLSTRLGDAPWRGTIFRNDRMENGARTIARRVALYMLDVGEQDEEKLLGDYQGHLEDSNAALPEKLS